MRLHIQLEISPDKNERPKKMRIIAKMLRKYKYIL